jgi:hypothetical protein
MPSAKINAVAIAAGKLTKAIKGVQVRAGESLIADAHWAKCAAKCKGEAAMLAALKVTDQRTAAEKGK